MDRAAPVGTDLDQPGEAQARLAAIVEGSSDAILSTNLEGIVTSWNAAAERQFGYSAAEMIGQSVLLIIPPERHDEETKFLELLRSGKRVDQYETVRVCRDGRKIAALVSCSPIRDAAGRLVGASKIIHDINNRKAAEEALRKSEERYRTLFNAIDEGFCIIEVLFDEKNKPVDYRFLETNPSFEKQTGLGNARSKRMRELAPLHEDYWFDIYGRIALTGQAARFERRAAQLNRWYDVYAFRFGQPEQRQVGILFNDITQRKQNEEALSGARQELARVNADLERKVETRTLELREMMNELRQLSYSMVHDMRAPLRAIQSFAGIVQQDSENHFSKESQEMLAKMRAAAERMDHLVMDALDYTRMVDNELPLSAVPLGELIPGMVQTYPDLQPPHAVVTVSPDLPVVVGHQSTLTQCLSHLLHNAVKFAKPGETPRIQIWARPQRDGWERVVVEDNGIGVATEHQGKVFGMFERLGHGGEGTGMGLAIVKKAVQRMGGRVGVESQLGHGSRFWFELKAAVPKEPVATAPPNAGPQ